MMKRGLDLFVAVLGLFLLSPLLLLVAALIKLDSRGPVFFLQERIGRGFRPFFIYKFRTMTAGGGSGAAVTVGADPRITRAGRFLRKAKIDEIPQLINVLKGEMSLVGPRPEMREFVELYRSDYQELLTVRPGITDPASLKYSDEAEFLSAAADPARAYVEQILPDKIRLAKEYVRRASLLYDLRLILQTVGKLFSLERSFSRSR